ncbi:MAG TPA: hypothetical protein VHW90_05850, partial [Stellaceae bacterium]|nr:hypothetical protein [Stellaceae bacterium]
MSAKILFSAKDATHGTELWVTDGSTASYIDVYPGSGSSYPLYITSLGNGKALFSAATATSTGKELFVTDGTPGGTKLVTDINTSTGSYPGGNMKAGIVALG